MTTGNEIAPTQLSKAQRIEDKIDPNITGQITVSKAMGGITFRSVNDVCEFAKLMSVAGGAVPPHLRNNPGACMAVVIQAIEWRMSPFAVASKTYIVNDRLAFESQLIHAVIEQRAPLAKRLRHRFEGEGGDMRCIVTGWVKGEDEPFIFRSPRIADIKPKNSPLWQTKPEVQLFYNASRDWARVFFPDVIMGVYSDDELDKNPNSTVSTDQRQLEEIAAQKIAADRATTVQVAAGGDTPLGEETQVEPGNEDDRQMPTGEGQGEQPMTPWEIMLITIKDIAESRGVKDVDQIKQAAGKSIADPKKRKHPEKMTAEDCKPILDAATAAAPDSFWTFMAPM